MPLTPIIDHHRAVSLGVGLRGALILLAASCVPLLAKAPGMEIGQAVELAIQGKKVDLASISPKTDSVAFARALVGVFAIEPLESRREQMVSLARTYLADRPKIQDREILAGLLQGSTTVHDRGTSVALDFLTERGDPKILATMPDAILRPLEGDQYYSWLMLVAYAKPTGALEVLQRLAIKHPHLKKGGEWMHAMAANGDQALETHYIQSFLTTEDARRKMDLAKALRMIGTRKTLSALAQEMRTPLVYPIRKNSPDSGARNDRRTVELSLPGNGSALPHQQRGMLREGGGVLRKGIRYEVENQASSLGTLGSAGTGLLADPCGFASPRIVSIMRIPSLNRHRVSSMCLCALASMGWSTKPSVEERCARYAQRAIPPREMASMDSLPKSDTCSSYAYYFGFGCVQDFGKAKAKAYVEREGKVDDPFRGASLLSMVYANGHGGPRDLALAAKFSCEPNSAEAESEGRLDHLESLAEDDSPSGNFTICDDITSGYRLSICTTHRNRLHEIQLRETLAEIIRGWNKAERDSFERFWKGFDEYNKLHAGREVDMSGITRGAMYIEEFERGEDSLVASLLRFEKGIFPRAFDTEFRRSDSMLNRVYQKIQRDTATPMGTVQREDIRRTQRRWIAYRDSWVRFARVKYPTFDEISIKDWLTRDRIKELEDLAER
jgi:hypothetical protein